MSLLGRFRAALGRDDASLLARARVDVRMGLGLNPPACLAPLNRAIAALERLPNTPEIAMLLGRALRAKAQTLSGQSARDYRARAVAKVTAMLDRPNIAPALRADLYSALAQGWLPLPEEAAQDPDLSYRQLLRAKEAQAEALSVPSVVFHLEMAEIALALCQHPLCPTPRDMAALAWHHARAVDALTPTADQSASADALKAAVVHLFPGLRLGESP